MTITAIEPQKKRKERFNVFVDGTFAFGIDAYLCLKFKLKPNLTLTKEELDEIIKESELGKVYDKVLSLLSRRPHSQKEITDYLNKKEVGSETQKRVIEKLSSQNYINDKAFALWFIEQRQRFRPKGKQALRQELRMKGIDQDLIAQIFEETTLDESELATRLLEKKTKSWAGLTSEKRKQKAAQFLARRGFGWDVIKGCIETVISG